MKRFNFNQTGGFKLTTETFSGLQDAYSIVEGVARMAGNMAIVSGCEELSNSVVSDGVVLINGELLDFKQGIKINTVIIKTERIEERFENGDLKLVTTYRYATFGVSENYFEWAAFHRITPLNTLEARLSKLEKAAAPILTKGALLVWNRPANEIPEGWEEATEFRGRMPFGYTPADGDFDAVGKTGGSKTHTLSISELPRHSFKIFGGDGMNTTPIVSNPDATPAGKGDSPWDNQDWNYTITSSGGEAYAGNTNALGNNQAHNNMSPYRIVLFIRYKG